MIRCCAFVLAALVLIAIDATPALAQTFSLDLGDGGGPGSTTARVV